MIKEMLIAMEKIRPKKGFIVVGIDSFELPGEELFVIKKFEFEKEAQKFSKTRKNSFVLSSKTEDIKQ